MTGSFLTFQSKPIGDQITLVKREKYFLMTATSGLDQAAAERKLHPGGSILFEMKDENPLPSREQLRSFGMTLSGGIR